MRPAHHTSLNPFSFAGSGFLPDIGLGPDGAFALSGFPPVLGPTAGPTSSTPSAVSQTVLYSPDATKAHGGGSRSTSSTSTTTSTTSPTTNASTGLVINVSWDASVSSAPAGFQTAVMNAVQFLEATFDNPVTLNISVGYGEVMGATLGSSTLGASESYLSSNSYSSLLNALGAGSTTAADATAVASLPSTSPVNGTFWTTTAEAKALGLAAATGTGTDGYVGFSSSLPFTYSDNAGVAAGTYDFNGVALHEMTEVMGRMLLTGGTVGSTANSYMLYDLFHYSAPGVRDLSASTPGYFSDNGGMTSLAAFNTVSGGDAGDWASSVTNDAVDAFSNSGVVNGFSTADLTAMDVIGWKPGASGSTTTPSPSPSPTPAPSPAPAPTVATPTGVSITASAAALAGLQISSGLAANTGFATVTETGGTSGDQFSYSLGGGGAVDFSLTDANNQAALSTGATAVVGAADGKAYALTVTAHDTTNSTSSPAAPLEVVVGSSGSDTIRVESLVGTANAAAPTFIFGGGGGDVVSGSGMTGPLFLTSGVGADRFTGGSGANHYLFGAIADSPTAAPDLITDFHAATDVINLSGLGFPLAYDGKVGGKSKLAAHSIEWTSSRGATAIYVNTSAGAESMSTANMKIDLSGSIALSNSNFVHL